MDKFEKDEILLVDINEGNMDVYLPFFRDNSDYRMVYQSMEDVWDAMASGIRKDYKNGEIIGSLIYRSKDMELCGFIEISECKKIEPAINITIKEEYRNQGIGSIAASMFIEYIFEKYDYSRIKWEAYISNEASKRVARKIGGVESSEKGSVEKMLERLQDAAGTNEELLRTVLYYIDRK